MRLNKKGALELSINAIVIIILAMTLLGLGLAFVRSIFANMGDTAGTVQDQVREQITEDLRTGNKPLSFPTSEITLPKKNSKNLAVGVRNTMQGSSDFKIRIYSIDEDTGEKIVNDAGEPGNHPRTFTYNKGTFSLSVEQDHIMPIKYTADTQTGTTIYELIVYSQLKCDSMSENECGLYPDECTWASDSCSAQGSENPFEEFATKSFFITIT